MAATSAEVQLVCLSTTLVIRHEVSLVFEERLLAKFPEGALEFEQLRWKALQLTTELASTGSVSSRSRRTSLTMVSLWPVVIDKVAKLTHFCSVSESGRLGKGLQMSTEFCSIEMEDGQELRVTEDVDSQEENADAKELPTLHLVQLNRTFVRRHMYSLVELLFKSEDGSATRFLSYSETGDDISVVTSDENFLEKARALMKQGDQGVLVSPDFWRPVQIGNTKLGFAETGIVAGQTRVLNAFHFYQDFMLIKEDEWEDALPILRDHFSLTEGVFAPLTA
ncbi:hypothetical protein GQ600_10026 [Phytophthora cactorum]|nr:hypothetical protein GQ600_10026 [Phytophthora cactorum]